MDAPLSTEQQKNWDEVQRTSRSLTQAGDLIAQACTSLERFCPPDDPDNWDRGFAWKLNELKQTISVCREVAQHLKTCAHQATAKEMPEGM